MPFINGSYRFRKMNVFIGWYAHHYRRSCQHRYFVTVVVMNMDTMFIFIRTAMVGRRVFLFDL